MRAALLWSLACLSACASRPAAKAAPPHATLAITSVRVFDGEKVLPRATVLVDGSRIVAVAAEVTPAAGVETIDGTGKTLLPGLIDAHVHVFDPAQLEQALVFGVTTVLDMPSTVTFKAGKDFAPVALPWSAFDGADGSDVMALLIGAVDAGKLELFVDDVEVK